MTGTEGALYPFWSPDSRQVGFFQASKLKSVDPGSGAVQILCDAPDGRGGTWNNRGTIIFAAFPNTPGGGSTTGLLKVSDSGGEPQPVTMAGAPNATIIWPSALPDRDHFIYFIFGSSNSPQKQGIYVGSLSTQETKLISSEIIGNTQFASSRLYYVRDGSLMAQPFDLKRLQTTGPPDAVSRQELEQSPAFSHADSPSRTTVWWSSSQQPKAFPRSHGLTVPVKNWKNYPEPAIGILLSPAMTLCSQSPPTMIATAGTTSIFTISPGVQAPVCQMEGQKYFRFSRLTAKGWHM